MVSGRGSQQGVVQKLLGSRGIFKYQGGSSRQRGATQHRGAGAAGGQAAPEQPKPGSGSALRQRGSRDRDARLGTGRARSATRLLRWRLHCCGAACPLGWRLGHSPGTAIRGNRPGKLPPSTRPRDSAAQQLERDTASCINPPHPPPRQPPPPGPPFTLIRFLPIVILVSIPIVAVLVLLGEVSLGAQG